MAKIKSEAKEESGPYMYIPLNQLIARIEEYNHRAGIFGLRVNFPSQRAKANALHWLITDFGTNLTTINEIKLGKKHAELEARARRLQSASNSKGRR